MSALEFPVISSLFTDEEEAEKWLVEARWPDGVRCALCDSERVKRVPDHRMPFRCLDCHRYFSVTTNTAMHSTNLDYRQLVIAFTLMAVAEEGSDTGRLTQDLNTSYRTAWLIANKIREVWETYGDKA